MMDVSVKFLPWAPPVLVPIRDSALLVALDKGEREMVSKQCKLSHTSQSTDVLKAEEHDQ